MKQNKTNLVLFLTVALTMAVVCASGYVALRYMSQDIDVPVVQVPNSNVSEPAPVITLPDLNKEEAEVPVVAAKETIQLPYAINAKQSLAFFDTSKSDQELENAVVEYDGVYRPNLGVVYTYDGKAFEAVAMMSGVVQNVYEDPLMGNTVVIKNGTIEMTYQGLASTAVTTGDSVKQNDVIGVAGTSKYHEKQGIHVFVLCKVNGAYVDAGSLVNKTVDEVMK